MMADYITRLFYCLATPRDLSVFPKPPTIFLVGVPGIGKTHGVRLAANALGIEGDHYVRFNGGGMSDSDFHGLPWPTEQGIRYEVDERIMRLLDGKPSIIHVDEAGNMLRSTQAAALTATDTGQMGRHTLPNTAAFVLGMNPPSSGTDSQEMGFAWANRGEWLSCDAPSREEFMQFLAKRGKVEPPTLPDPAVVKAAFPVTYSTLVGIYGSFLEMPELGGTTLEDVDSDEVRARFTELVVGDSGEKVFQPAYATPRSVNMGLNFAATALCYGDWAAAIDLMCGAFGRSQGMKFGAFAQRQDIVNPVALLKGEAVFVVNPERPDRTMCQVEAVVRVALSGALPGDPMKWWNAAVGVAKDIHAGGAEKALLTNAVATLGMNRPKGAMLADHEAFITELRHAVFATIAN